jgi:hypothetical protein
MKNHYLIFFLWLSFIFSISVEAQNFQIVDKSPHDIVYYRKTNLMPPLVKVLYGRPQKEGREIFGELVPYNKVWRVGANETTEITFYEDVVFGDKEVMKGTYTLYAIPGAEEWTIILSSNLDTWGTSSYNEKYDVARVKAKVRKAEEIEVFSIGFKEKGKAIDMIFGWDTTRVIVPIS